MKTALLLIALVMLSSGACVPEPEIVVVSVAPKPIALPPECTSADKNWQDPRDADVHLKEAVRRDRTNKDNYNEILGKRHVCRSAINTTSAKK